MFVFNPDNFLVRGLVKYFNILLAFLMWLLCCAPIITIGASSTAYSAVLMRLARENEDIPIIRDFFRSFADNFRQATIVWIILALASGVGLLDLYAFRNVLLEDSAIRSALVVAVLFLCGCLGVVMIYIFPVIARFQVTIRQAFRNGLAMGFRNLFTTVLFAGMLFSCLILLYKLEMFSPFLIALLMYIMAVIFTRIFSPFDGTQKDKKCENDEDDS